MLLLSVAIEDFLSHCKIEKNLSLKTLKAYRTDIEQLRKFLLDFHNSQEIESISKTELRAYIDSMSDLKPKSIKRKIASTKAMFNYLEYEDQISKNPFRKMRIKIKEPRHLPATMNLKEISRIFQTAYENTPAITKGRNNIYDRSLIEIIVIELLFATGGRVSEIANLKDDAINLESGIITITGKGNKERIIQICNPDSIQILKYYQTLFKEQIKQHGFFLINRLNKKLSDQSIRHIVRKIGRDAKLDMPVKPHMFRHSFATLLLEQDVDIKYIQTMLGHSSITTTQIYTHVNKEKQRQILFDKHPRKHIKLNLENVAEL